MFGTLPPLRAAIHHERLKFSGSLAALFGDVDLLLVPTMPMPIPTLAKMGEGVLLSILRFTAVFDFSGSPTITLPVGMASDQMPLSMQLVGSHLSEEVLARAAHAFQSTTDWHTQRPPIR
jgi:amidase